MDELNISAITIYILQNKKNKTKKQNQNKRIGSV